MVKKNVWTVIFAADLIAHAIVGYSFSDATFMGAVFKRITQHGLLWSVCWYCIIILQCVQYKVSCITSICDMLLSTILYSTVLTVEVFQEKLTAEMWLTHLNEFFHKTRLSAPPPDFHSKSVTVNTMESKGFRGHLKMLKSRFRNTANEG